MSYEDYIKKFQYQINQAKQSLENPAFKQTLEYLKSDEYKEKIAIIKQKEKIIHKDIIQKIEFLQNNIR